MTEGYAFHNGQVYFYDEWPGSDNIPEGAIGFMHEAPSPGSTFTMKSAWLPHQATNFLTLADIPDWVKLSAIVLNIPLPKE